jgi:predicted PurR-regulated permease PerM
VFPQDPQEPKLVAWVRNARVRRTLILSTLWIFIAVVLIFFRLVLLPFGLAVLLAFIIEPIVTFISSRKLFGKAISRVAAVLSIYVVLGLFAWAFGSWAVGQLSREVAKLGALSTRIVHQIEPMTNDLLDRTVAFAEENKIPVSRDEIETFFKQNLAVVAEELGHNTSKVITMGRDLVRGTFQAIFGTFLVLMLTAFMSIDRTRIQRFFWSLVPPEYHGGYGVITSGVSQGLAGVVRGQVMICLMNGIFTFIGLWLFGVKLPLLLAMLATVFSLIPIFGSILSSIPIVAISLTDSLAKGLFMLLWIIGVHLMEANFLNPKIMGDAAKIHPVVVVFALIVGEQTSGLIGALFAVPIASVVLTIFKFLHRRALEGVKEIEPPSPLQRTASAPPSQSKDLPAEAAPRERSGESPPAAELRKAP